MTTEVVAAPPRSEMFALRVLQAGAIAVVVTATTLYVFELDRFFVPKELALHVAALLAGFIALRALQADVHRSDTLLALYLVLSFVSAIFATNHWLALRAIAISASSIVVFWAARALRNAGRGEALLAAVATAAVVVCVSSLLQTYGVDLIVFSENRAPGGTLGNRNFIAHVAAFGAPLLLYFTARAQRFLFAAIGFALVVATLVLTRSRAAWLAFAAALLVFLIGLLFRREARAWGRVALAVACAAIATAGALLLPNSLEWVSKNPYVQSAKHVIDYEGGSGRGRLLQYGHSMSMAIRHPLLGVGPGNWPVEYPANAPRRDPSMNEQEPGTTSNPWPSSDWVAWISERGFAAAIVLALAFAAIAFDALRSVGSAPDPNVRLRSVTLLATLVAALIAGMFDAVLLTAVPAFLVWASLGALSDHAAHKPGRYERVVAIIAIVICGVGVIRSSSQLVAMNIYASRTDRASLERAAAIDPGSYRLAIRLARMGGKHRCEYAERAVALMPHARGAIAASTPCHSERSEEPGR